MKQLSMQKRLWLGSGSLLVILLSVGMVSYWAARKTDTLTHTAQFNNRKQDIASTIELAIEKEKVGGRDTLLDGDDKYLIAARAEFAQQMATLQPLLSTPTSHQLFEEIQEANTRYSHLADEAIQAHRAGDQAKALVLFYGPAAQQARADLKKSSSDLVTWYSKLAADAQAEQLAASGRSTLLIGAFTLPGLVVGILVALGTIRTLVHSITPIVAVMESIANHDLCIPDVEVKTHDELGHAGVALNTMKANLTRMVRSITQSAQQLAAATEQIAQSARQNSTSAHAEAQQAVQVASAMQQMSATVREVAGNAHNASSASEQSATAARNGGAVAGETLATMSSVAVSTSNAADRILALGKSSEQIGNIVAVITEIAGQTNLLALNAAIEAARAGEQGRGFAVVAGEVRRLAERTASATQEIAAMIRTIQDETRVAVEAIEQGKLEVELGVQKTRDTGNALEEIIRMSDRVGQMVAQIASAASQQQSASDQISASISEISTLTQTSSFNAGQTAQACSHLSQLASELHRLVNEFCVHEEAEQTANRSLAARQNSTRPDPLTSRVAA